MHDVVRDMALLIASEGSDKIEVMSGKGLSQWHPRNATESYIGISLMRNKICKLPDHEFHFPHLDSFLIPDNELESIPDKFIRAIKNVKVLDMKDNEISSLPQSFNLLTKLCMLNLSGNHYIDEISILGELKNLQILILNRTEIEEIPKEIGQLTKLRCLSAKFCYSLSQIAPGVISNLYLLEELCVSFINRCDTSSLEEIPNLPFFTKLELIVPDFDGIPKNLEFGKLKYFEIIVGTDEVDNHFPYVSEYKRILILNFVDIPNMKPYSNLIKAAEEIDIYCDESLENILPIMFSEGVDEFKGITISGGEASCLVDIRNSDDLGGSKTYGKFFSKVKSFKLEVMDSLEILWSCPDEYISFHDLVKFEIHLENIKRLFPVSVAKGLVNLQSLILKYCNNLESVICVGDEEEADFEFPRLTLIRIECLAKLKSFCNGYSTIKYPSLEEMCISYCPNMKTWGYGIHDMPKMDFRHQGTSYNINDYMLIPREKKQSTIFSSTGCGPSVLRSEDIWQ
nr:NB-ARC domains-containing protein [Tanacetum cinerariifolium]